MRKTATAPHPGHPVRHPVHHRARLLPALLALSLGLGLGFLSPARAAEPAVAPATAPLPASPLARAFAAAWERQPLAAALPQRQDAARAQQEAADSLLAQPPSLDLSTRTDRYNRDRGAREVETGIALPLWLPGEKDGTRALADARKEALGARTLAARLQLAAELRSAWWAWQQAGQDQQVAQARADNAARLASDVERRMKAGDLSRADLNQAQGAQAAAQAALAESRVAALAAARRLQSLTGQPPRPADGPPQTEPEPAANALPESLADEDGADAESAANGHPLLQDLAQRSAVSRRALELASRQTRANPEIAISTRRDRSATGEMTDQTWALALRLPFSSTPRNQARIAEANADLIEAETQLRLERQRLAQEGETARAQLDAARLQLAAAETRARLAAENRGFYDKAFRLGEADLPTRLRIELEAFEAERQAVRSRIQAAAALSQLRQALGLLPE